MLANVPRSEGTSDVIYNRFEDDVSEHILSKKKFGKKSDIKMIAFAYQMSEKLKSVNVRYSRGKSHVGKKERKKERK